MAVAQAASQVGPEVLLTTGSLRKVLLEPQIQHARRRLGPIPEAVATMVLETVLPTVAAVQYEEVSALQALNITMVIVAAKIMMVEVDAVELGVHREHEDI